MRRLQLGAETGQAWGVLFRSASAAQERSTAALRLRLEATANGLAVHILKRRGGQVSKPVRLNLQQTNGVRRTRSARRRYLSCRRSAQFPETDPHLTAVSIPHVLASHTFPRAPSGNLLQRRRCARTSSPSLKSRATVHA